MTRIQEEADYKMLWILKECAEVAVRKQMCFAYHRQDEILNELDKAGLRDVLALQRIAYDLVEKHNSEIKAKLTLIMNLKWDSNGRWKSSKLLRGLSSEAEKAIVLIQRYPDKTAYEIYNVVIGRQPVTWLDPKPTEVTTHNDTV